MHLEAIAVSPEPERQVNQAWLWFIVLTWLTAVACMLWVLWSYDNKAGADATPPQEWPVRTVLVPAADRPTLVMIAHPQCPCTRASLGELAEALARAPQPPKTYVLFLRPAVFAAGWEQTDLWRSAARLPNVIVLRDDDGTEARRFGAATSGQTLLYDRNGELIFSGGITGSRGHAGDNAGRATLVSLLAHAEPDRHAASVFGCPLFASAN